MRPFRDLRTNQFNCMYVLYSLHQCNIVSKDITELNQSLTVEELEPNVDERIFFLFKCEVDDWLFDYFCLLSFNCLMRKWLK